MADWLDDRTNLARSQDWSSAIGSEWTQTAEARINGAFAGAAADDVEATAAAAERLLGEEGWVGELLAPLTRALRDDPAFTPPLRVHRDALRTAAVLHDGAHATISVSVLSADAMATLPAPATLVASGRMSVVCYHRAGGATLRVWDAPVPTGDLAADAVPRCTPAAPVALADGMVARLDGRVRAHLIEGAQTDVVMLTVALRAGAAAQVREYARDDGRLVRAADLVDTQSRIRVLLTLLRVSGRADAGECFEGATHEPGFALRWAAMREWLALDARAALPRLAEMANDPNAEVRSAARATLAMVEERLAA